MNGDLVGSSAVTNSTFLAMSPAINATSRDNRSNLATTIGAPSFLALRSASANTGAALERVRTFARLDFSKLISDRRAVAGGICSNSFALSL